MKRYAIDLLTTVAYTNPAGQSFGGDVAKEIMQIAAPRAGTALRKAEVNFPGRKLRARLIA